MELPIKRERAPNLTLPHHHERDAVCQAQPTTPLFLPVSPGRSMLRLIHPDDFDALQSRFSKALGIPQAMPMLQQADRL
jgi:hypothetical protein